MMCLLAGIVGELSRLVYRVYRVYRGGQVVATGTIIRPVVSGLQVPGMAIVLFEIGAASPRIVTMDGVEKYAACGEGNRRGGQGHVGHGCQYIIESKMAANLQHFLEGVCQKSAHGNADDRGQPVVCQYRRVVVCVAQIQAK